MLSNEVSELGQGIKNMMFLLEELLSGHNTPAFCPAHSSDTCPAHVTMAAPPLPPSYLQFQQNSLQFIQSSTSGEAIDSLQCSAEPRTVPSPQRPPQLQLVYTSSTPAGAPQSSASVPHQCGPMQTVQCTFPQRDAHTPTSQCPPAALWTLPFRGGLAGSLRSHSLESTLVSFETKSPASLQRLRSLPQEILLSPRDPEMERAADS